MANETPTPATPSTVEEMNNEQYIAAIEELKATTVPRDAYNKLRSENKRLLDSLVSGEKLPIEEKPKSIQELCEAIYSPSALMKTGACENAENILALRNGLIEAGAKDPFVDPALADLMEHCLEIANGNDKVFSAEFEGHLVDDALPTPGANRASRKW